MSATAERPPNIVYLMTDDQRFDSLGCMGNDVIETPNIDAMARRGVVFDNAMVTTAICMTSRASVLTGQYAARHGVWDFKTKLTPPQIADTYLGRLQDAGYRTGFIGKWGVGHPSSVDDVLDYRGGFVGQSRYFEGKGNEKTGRHLTARLGDQAIEFLDGCDGQQPFHLSISFKAPHCQDSRDILSDQFPSDPDFASLYRDATLPRPATATSEHHERLPDFIKDGMNRDRWAVRFRSPSRYQRSVKDYYRLISGVDAVVGRIREALDRRGFADDTVIIFTSDHGFFLGEFGLAGKWTPHEISIRVPLVVYDPRRGSDVPARRDQTVLNIDMAPTMLDYAGVEPPAGMQGESFRPFIEDASAAGRNSFFYEHWFTADGRIPPSEGVRGPRYKYMRYLWPDRCESGEARYESLYDLRVDPQETIDLANDPSHRRTLDEMRHIWERMRSEVR